MRSDKQDLVGDFAQDFASWLESCSTTISIETEAWEIIIALSLVAITYNKVVLLLVD